MYNFRTELLCLMKKVVIRLGYQDVSLKSMSFKNVFDNFLSGTLNATEEEFTNIMRDIANIDLQQLGYNSSNRDMEQSYIFIREGFK